MRSISFEIWKIYRFFPDFFFSKTKRDIKILGATSFLNSILVINPKNQPPNSKNVGGDRFWNLSPDFQKICTTEKSGHFARFFFLQISFWIKNKLFGKFEVDSYKNAEKRERGGGVPLTELGSLNYFFPLCI